MTLLRYNLDLLRYSLEQLLVTGADCASPDCETIALQWGTGVRADCIAVPGEIESN